MSVLEISLSAIYNNIANVRKLLKYNQKLCFVCKSNAYGYGAKKMCKLLNDKVDYFAVSSVKEFYEIITIITKPVIILDPVYFGIESLIKRGAELTISNFETLEKVECLAEKCGVKAMVHIAINTGMNRFGFKDFADIKKVVNKLKKSQNIIICGVFSHYFEANNDYFAKNQKELFLKSKYLFDKNFNNLIYHISASEGVKKTDNFDMVRVGMSVYSNELFNTITLKSNVLEIQNLSEHETAGYGAIFTAKKQTKLAIVGIGYGDGLHRNIVNNGYVLINKNKAKIVAVCMDSIMVDVTNISVKLNDEVILIGSDGKNKISICDMASWCDTISYEIIVHLTKRVERKYIT